MAISRRHHEVPRWLLRWFCFDSGESLWMGFVGSGEVKAVRIGDAFVRKDANTRTDFEEQADGSMKPVRSDRDENLLAQFDGAASSAARKLITLARQHRDGVQIDSGPAQDTLETCKRLIVAQARRTRESQDRVGFGEDQSEIVYEVAAKRAVALGETISSRAEMVGDPRFADFVSTIEQNHRATFAGGSDPLDIQKEIGFLDPLGLHVAVIDSSTMEFVIGSHGTTIVPSGQGANTWLPLAPDVAISFSDKPRHIGVGICHDDFVERHNQAVVESSKRIAGRTKQVVEDLL
ncbi:MAG: DUF4238 domain-containing protein [Chloroflexota bacterium]|nr:DUF4238 domain-containing protein [Chloroflexota bacterium]